ncbi:MAG: hypothetical protein HXL22_02795, partial [Peptostreptococcus sp.]|nr:hypothetical protein [Peptostreptococcus sp.]
MTFFNNIFKLYYHELKVNKKIIILLGVAVFTWFLFCVFNFYRGQYSAGDLNLVKDLSPQIIAGAPNDQDKLQLSLLFRGSINISSTMNSNILMIAPICLASILASYFLVSRDFRKKNSSFYLIYNIPNSILEIKLAKILVGLSQNIYTIILITLALVCLDCINQFKFADLYRPGIWSLTKEALFLPFDYMTSLFYTFMLALPSIIGLQASTSIIYGGNIRTRLAKRVGFFILIILSAFIVII